MRIPLPSSDEEVEVHSRMPSIISEELQDSIMTSDGEGPAIYSPPPHIATRFYRNSMHRRKSSAASSRRNSMSSHHSKASTRSAHGGPQSTHIAQHLRRASIIQSRKDKAADRNAHAEKVRLRAALNKAAPRVTTNSEERSLAAQRARERYLAQVKASCAEEVKRSKRVAEEQREKRAAEHLRLKEDMEERHAEAEKRKALLQQSQRRARTTSLATVEEKRLTTFIWKPRDKVEASRIIQVAWRNHQRRRTIQEFMRLGLTIEAIQKTSFEEISVLLRQDAVINCAAKVLEQCGLRARDDNDVSEKAAIRTFLSIFLILGHPSQVLSNEGEQEQDLVNKAKNLLLHFNRLIDQSPHHSPVAVAAQLADLSEAYKLFQTSFIAWKSRDSSYLVSGILAQFLELDAIWQTVKDDKDGEVAADYKQGIQQNQTLMLVKLKRLVGHERAMKMIREGIRASRKERSKTRPRKNSKPRAIPVDQGSPSAKPPLPVAESSLHAQGLSTSVLDQSLPAKRRIESSTLLPDNRRIMHELAINKEFKVDFEPKKEMRDSIIADVKTHMQQCVDHFDGDLWIPTVADIIREKLLKLLTPGNSLHVLISDTLDPAMIESQVQNSAFSYDKFFLFMNTILPKLCAPVRDEDVKNLAERPSQDPLEQLARTIYVIDLLQLDHTNFTLTRWAPMLLERFEAYEREAFDQRLADTFPTKTLRWWRAATAKINEETSRRTTDSSADPTNRITADKIYMQGLVDFAISIPDVLETDVPETLELDHHRFARIRYDILCIIRVSSILVTAKSLLRRDVRSLWKNESQRMWDLPLTSPSAAFVSIVESRYALPPTTKSQLMGTVTRILTDVRDGNFNHPVMKVLHKKIHAHILARLAASSAEERMRTSASASEVLGSSGMIEFVNRIGDMVQELSRVATVDRETHGEWYEKVARRAAQEDARDEGKGTSNSE